MQVSECHLALATPFVNPKSTPHPYAQSEGWRNESIFVKRAVVFVHLSVVEHRACLGSHHRSSRLFVVSSGREAC